MKKETVIWLVVVLVLVLVLVGRMEQMAEGSPLEKWEIHIVNGLSKGQMLLVHCKSKDNDLGEHNLTAASEFNWSFRVNLWDSTLFWCFLRKPNGQHKSFEAFWVEKESIWLYYRCLESNCTWTAKDDGIYLANNPDKTQLLIHKWDN